MKCRKTRSNFSILLRILLLILIFAGIIYGVTLLFNQKNNENISDQDSKIKVIDLENAVVDVKKTQNQEESTSAETQNTQEDQKQESKEIKIEENPDSTNPEENKENLSIEKHDDQDNQGEVKEEVTSQDTQTQTDKPSQEKKSQEKQKEFTLSPQFNQEIANRFSYVKNEPNSIHVMLNKKNAFPEGFQTPDLVVPDIKFPFSHETPKKYMRKEAAQALTKLCAAAQADGHTIYGVSGYRSYETQKNLYNMYVNKDGKEAADQYSSRPGHSEHQSGLVMDVSSKDGGFDLLESFGNLPEGKWIAQNSHKYGFIVRYLKDKVDITGYDYEPWHLRYVGEEVATYMYENNLCFEEFYDIIGVPYNK